MTRALSFPLSEQLLDPLARISLHDSWSAIEARLDLEKSRRFPFVQSFEARATLSLTAALVTCVALFFLWPSTDREFGPLRLTDGSAEFAIVVPEGAAPRVLDFEDASRIEIKAGSLRTLKSEAKDLSLHLERGHARFEVTPGGPRKWSVHSPLGSVEVMGTVFHVQSEEHSLSVKVERGAVLVRSQLLSGGTRVLSAGQSVKLTSEEAAPEAPEMPAHGSREPTAIDTSLTLDELTEEPSDAAPLNSASRARELEVALEVAPSTAAELEVRADAARGAGRLKEAAQILAQLVEQHPSDARAPAAAFSLGTIQLQHLHQPSQAIQSFQTVIRLSAPASLKEDAYRRWFDALLGQRNQAAAQAVFEEYQRAFRSGRHRGAMQEALDRAAVSKDAGSQAAGTEKQ
jgi:transmembrane sensor